MNDIQFHRVAIGLFYANQRIPQKIRHFHLICNAFREIIYILYFMMFFSVFLIRKMFLSINTSSIITMLLIKFVSNGKITQKDHYCLIYPIMVENLMKKQKINPKQLIMNLFNLLFSIKMANFLFLCEDIQLR